MVGSRAKVRARVRPRGRSERIRETVARACLTLLGEGKIDLAAAEVAERSGVSRTTIYRWWPTPTDLLREALAFHTRRLDPPDTGSWPGDVRALIAQLAAFLGDPVERAQNSIMASGLYPAFNEFMLDYFEPIVAGWRRVVERSIDRGEISRDVDSTAVVSLIASPLLVITLLQRRSPTAEELRRLARLIVRATAKPPRASDADGARSTRGSKATRVRSRRAK
jgi:AcrR family transcriptional regulator